MDAVGAFAHKSMDAFVYREPSGMIMHVMCIRFVFVMVVYPVLA
jgi:hypothetical protein